MGILTEMSYFAVVFMIRKKRESEDSEPTFNEKEKLADST